MPDRSRTPPAGREVSARSWSSEAAAGGVPASSLDLDAISVDVGAGADWVSQAASIFSEQRVVVLRGLLSEAVTDAVLGSLRDLHSRWGLLHDPEGLGNRCPGRYDMGSAYSSQHLTQLPGYLEALEEFSQRGGLRLLELLGGYAFVGGQGTLCRARTDNWQPMHSDCYKPWHEELREEPEHVPCLDLMFTVHPLTGENGAMRILPGQPSVDKVYRQQEHPPPKLDGEPWPSRRSQLFPLPAGCGILRDIRVWHGGVPNSTGEDRHLAVLQFYSRRVLRLCPLWKERGRGVSESAVRSKLSPGTQQVVAAEIVLREGDEEPRLMAERACWPGTFSY